LYTFLLVLHLISAISLTGIVLLQAGKGGGLSGAFGSGMGSETLFGSRTGDMLTRATAVVATVFLCSALVMAYLSTKQGSSVARDIRDQQREEQGSAEQLKQLQELIKAKLAEDQAAKGALEGVDIDEKTDIKPPTFPYETSERPPLIPADAE